MKEIPRFMKLNQILEEKFRNFKFNDGLQIENWSFNLKQTNHIQNDRYYSGGEVRRIIGGLIFNNDPFNWLGIDLEVFKIIKPHNHVYPTARKADIELLLSSKHDPIKNCGEKLRETYKILNYLCLEITKQ